MTEKLDLGKIAALQAVIDGEFNMPVGRFPSVEDLWQKEDRVLSFLEGFTPAPTAVMRRVGKTIRVCPADTHTSLVLARDLYLHGAAAGDVDTMLQTKDLSADERLDMDLSAVREGQQRNPSALFTMKRSRGDAWAARQNVTNYRYPVAVWRVCEAFGLPGEEEARILAELAAKDGRRATVAGLTRYGCTPEEAAFEKKSAMALAALGLVTADGETLTLAQDWRERRTQDPAPLRRESIAEAVGLINTRYPDAEIFDRDTEKVLRLHASKAGREAVEEALLTDYGWIRRNARGGVDAELLRTLSDAVAVIGCDRHNRLFDKMKTARRVERLDV